MTRLKSKIEESNTAIHQSLKTATPQNPQELETHFRNAINKHNTMPTPTNKQTTQSLSWSKSSYSQGLHILHHTTAGDTIYTISDHKENANECTLTYATKGHKVQRIGIYGSADDAKTAALSHSIRHAK